jgi:hypothetical protein
VHFKKAVMAVLSWMIAGCATAPIVPPTQQELDSARPYKKTLVIANFHQDGTTVQNLKDQAITSLNANLSNYFNIADQTQRKNVDVRQGEYVMTGQVSAFASPAMLKNSEHKYEGSFTGNIWYEVCATADISATVKDSQTDAIIYAGQGRGHQCEKKYEQTFSDEAAYRAALQGATITNTVSMAAEILRTGPGNGSGTLTSALNEAAARVANDLRSRFPQQGQIIQILSKNEVLINIGSAFGIRPGDTLTVFSGLSEVKDPRTGMVVTMKSETIKLKVVNVNSGITSVAKGPEKKVALLKVGDSVTTGK